MSASIYRRQIPILVVSFFMAVLLIEYYAVKTPVITDLSSQFLSWGAIIAILQLLFGYLTLMRMHVRRISQYRSEGYNRLIYKSVIVMATFVAMLAIGLYEGKGNAGPMFTFWYSNIIAMAGVGTVLEWISHYSSPARMFKITSPESFVMLAVWFFIVLREMATMVVFFPQIEVIGDWIMKTPYMASNRGVMIAAGIGIVILAIRALVGKEPGLIEMEATK